MADQRNGGIIWTEETWNPIRASTVNAKGEQVGWHCEKVSAACTHCYAEGINKRFGTKLPFASNAADGMLDIFIDEKILLAPLQLKRPSKIFISDMSDIFGTWVKDEWLDRIFAVMALCPQHTFQVLTKRPERMLAYMSDPRRPHKIARAVVDLFNEKKLPKLTDKFFDERWPVASIGDPEWPDDLTLKQWPLPNVWLGITAENQEMADKRIPLLLETPATLRFVSIEPMLAPIDLRQIRIPGDLHSISHDSLSGYSTDTPHGYIATKTNDPFSRGKLDWVIAGGESGNHARGNTRAAARSLRDQCAAAGVPFLWKQNGEWIDADEWYEDFLRQLASDGVSMEYRGKPFEPKQPLNFEDAARLASFAQDKFEHQSDGSTLLRVGLKRAGRLLDGIEHLAFPEVR